jgi:hypothetical protein
MGNCTTNREEEINNNITVNIIPKEEVILLLKENMQKLYNMIEFLNNREASYKTKSLIFISEIINELKPVVKLIETTEIHYNYKDIKENLVQIFLAFELLDRDQ